MAASPHVEAGFATLPDRGELLDYAARDVIHDGAYTWHRAGVSESHALHAMANGHLRLTTPAGVPLDILYDRHVEHDSGDWTWIGHIAGHPDQQTILTFGAHAAFGTIGQPVGLPLRLTVRNGASWLMETDGSKIALIDNAATRPRHPDFKLPPRLPVTGQTDAGAVRMASAPATAAATASGSTTVDVVLGYTAGFANANGGTSGAITRLNYLVDVTNAAYANSGVAAAVRLVHAVAVSYADATSNETTLEKLTGYDSSSNKQTTPDPAFNALRAARETYGADLVSLVRDYSDPENEGCGIAWLIGGGQSGISTSDSYFGYSVVSDGTDAGTDGKNYFCLDETLAHELGHNMGAAHDVETSKGDDGTLDPQDYGAYPYSFGFKSSTAVTGGSNGFYTVMTYGDSGQKIFRIFSDPRSTFCQGHVCGSSSADNARTLSQTIPIIATFRASLAGAATRARDDFNGDGKSDLGWLKPGTLGTWLMNGGSLQHHSFAAVSSAYHVIGTGDLSGDGKADMLWTSAANDLYFWKGSGSGFTATRMAVGYPVGWTLAAVGDVNADGKDDLVWQQPGRMVYWIMNGSEIVRTATFSAGSAYHVIGSGDLNGDGRLDLVWTSSANDLYYWLGSGSRFTVQKGAVGFPVGWSLAGEGDVDADGRADLVWQQPGRVVYWKMSGSTIARSASFSVSSAYRIIGSGDYNGDAKLDLVFTSNAGDLYWWRGAGAGFVAARMGVDYPAGWSLVTH